MNTPSQIAVEAAKELEEVVLAGTGRHYVWPEFSGIIQSAIDKAAAGMVPIEDVKPLLRWLDVFLEIMPDMECHTVKRNFLAKHGDKLK